MCDVIRMTSINCILSIKMLLFGSVCMLSCRRESSSSRSEVIQPQAVEKLKNKCFGKRRFVIFPSFFSGSSGFGGRVGSLDAKLS